jgi:hypothetical protein
MGNGYDEGMMEYLKERKKERANEWMMMIDKLEMQLYRSQKVRKN